MRKWALGVAAFFGVFSYFMFIYRDPDEPDDPKERQKHWVDRLKPHPAMPQPPPQHTVISPPPLKPAATTASSSKQN